MKNSKPSAILPIEQIEQCIHIIRGHKVMLDQDLATLYSVPNKRLNEQVQRNIDRFPMDFSFQLTMEEWHNLKSHFATSSSWGGRRKRPKAFTEQGVAMLSGILHSPQSVAINIEIMRAFVRMRHFLASQVQVNKELAELKLFLLKHSNSNDREFRKVWQAIEKLSTSPSQKENRIGFDLS